MSKTITVHYQNQTIFKDVIIADDFLNRFLGYMFRQTPHVPGILFVPGGAIQTTFMKFNLDLAFLDKENKVIAVKRNVKPWRMTGMFLNSKTVLEVPAGQLPADLKVGDQLGLSQP